MIYDVNDAILIEIEKSFENFKNENESGTRNNLYIDKSASGKDLQDYIIVIPMTKIEFDDYDSILKNDIVITGYATTSKYNKESNALILNLKKEDEIPPVYFAGMDNED